MSEERTRPTGDSDTGRMRAVAVQLFPSLHGYRRSWLRPDIVAGLTVWAVLVPEALAYATIAGVPPVAGCTRRFRR